MIGVDAGDVRRMRDALFFEGPETGHRLTRFWALLLLAAVIAAAGVVADSTAVVIGAMIVAPLMTPILGVVLAIVIGDRANLVRSITLLVAGALAVVLVAWLLGALSAIDVVAPGNSQVAARISPRTIDLVAALATGAVGAFAVVRSDVSDALPGVAIAISLVPPLAVAGLTLEAGHGDQARGALLLFLTNVAAILVTGLAVMALCRIRSVAHGDASGTANDVFARRYPIVVVLAFAVTVAFPLVVSGRRYVAHTLTTERVATIASRWAEAGSWRVVSTQYREGRVVVVATGPPPAPDPARLRRLLDAEGERGTHVSLALVPEERVELPPSPS